MTPGARVLAAIELLAEIAATPRPADAVASAYFRARRFIGAKDRSAVAEMVYAVLRCHARLGWWLQHCDFSSPEDVRARVIAHAILAEGRRASSVERLFEGGRYNPDPFTAAEARLAQDLDQHTLERPDMPEAVRVECPEWAEPGLRRSLGGRFGVELAALTGPAPLDLRVNSLRAGRDDVLAGLASVGVQARACRLSPLGLRLDGRPAIAGLELFRSGAIEIQDEGSQLVALLADARPGQQVVDFCAGAGGKALAMAAVMNNRGRLIACDVLGNRLKRAAERFRRAGLHNIETRPLSSARDPWVKRHKAMFDRVLVDAPCTGTGTWRRNPDARWRPLGPGLVELVRLQAEILDSAARLVKRGGRLIYATCSLLAEENEDQMTSFLAAHPDFTPLPLAELWPATIGGPSPLDGPWLRLTPARHETDGFFAAVLVRGGEGVATGASGGTESVGADN
ncbi:MAG: RsmB/NOP family class I SAM-dependent RNA methyltransferase [Rhodospirillaceae bacterium]